MTPDKPNDKIYISSEVRLALFLFIIVIILSCFGKSPVKVEPIVVHRAIPIHATSSKEIVRGDTTKKQVIFTFDGGDGAQSAAGILNALAKHHVTGTFFLTGKFIEANNLLVKQMSAAGHDIFSHTYDHPYLTKISDNDISNEMSKMESVLWKTIGKSPKPYFRPPYGDRDARVIADTFKDGYQSVYWTVDARDWQQSTGETNASVKERIMANLAPGNIYLMHFGDTITGDILDDVFTEIEAKGYKIVSLRQGI